MKETIDVLLQTKAGLPAENGTFKNKQNLEIKYLKVVSPMLGRIIDWIRELDRGSQKAEIP